MDVEEPEAPDRKETPGWGPRVARSGERVRFRVRPVESVRVPKLLEDGLLPRT